MESHKDPILNKDLAPSEFDIIKEMLQAHINLLLQHSLYLRRIENKKVPDEDINHYVKDVLGFGIPSAGKFRESYLQILKETLDLKLKTFLKLSDLANQKDNAVAISSLCLGLEHELRYAEYESQIVNSPRMNLQDRIRAGLHSIDFIKSISKRLVPILPEGHKKLETIIVIKSIGKPSQKWRPTPEFRAAYSYNWGRLLNDQKNLLERLLVNLGIGKLKLSSKKDIESTIDNLEALKGSKFNNRKGDEMPPPKDNGETQDAIKFLTSLPISLNEIMEKNKIKDDLLMSDVDIAIRGLNLLCDNVQYFYSINPAIEKMRLMLELGSKFLELEGKFKRRFEDDKKDFQMEFNRLVRQVSNLKNNINSICRKKKWRNHWQVFAALLPRFEYLESELKNLGTLWPNTLASDFLESGLLALKEKGADLIAKIRLSFASLQDDYLNLLTLLENSVTEKPAVRQEVPMISLPDTERKVFLREREKENQEYKRQVEERRIEKEKRRHALPEKSNVEVKPNLTYINLNVNEILLMMSDSNVTLLKSILNFEKGISYKEVCNLIENQFKGEVEEIGGGSSHKRIRIAKYFVEVTSHETDEPISDPASVAVGGFFRPHGRAHESKMSRFNLELVANTFKKAGITLEVLTQREVERAARKNTINYGSNDG